MQKITLDIPFYQCNLQKRKKVFISNFVVLTFWDFQANVLSLYLSVPQALKWLEGM